MRYGTFYVDVRELVALSTGDGVGDEGMVETVLKLLRDLESTSPNQKLVRARIVRLFLREWPADGGDLERGGCVRRDNRIVWDVLKSLIVGGFEAHRAASVRLSTSARGQALPQQRVSEELGRSRAAIGAAARASAARSGSASGRTGVFGGGNTFGRNAEEEISYSSRGRDGERAEREEEREGENGDRPPSPPMAEASAETSQPRTLSVEGIDEKIERLVAVGVARILRDGERRYGDDAGRRDARDSTRVEAEVRPRRREDQRHGERARGGRGGESRRYGGNEAAAHHRAEYARRYIARDRDRDDFVRGGDDYRRGGNAPYGRASYDEEPRYGSRRLDQVRSLRRDEQFYADRSEQFGSGHLKHYHRALDSIATAHTVLGDQLSLDHGTPIVLGRKMGEFRRTGVATGRLMDVEAHRCILSEHELSLLEARATMADHEATEEATMNGPHVGIMGALLAGVREAARPGAFNLIAKSNLRTCLHNVMEVAGDTRLYRPSRPASQQSNQDITSKRGAQFVQAGTTFNFCEPPVNFCIREAAVMKFTSCNLDAAHLDALAVLRMLAGDMPGFVVAAGVILESWFVRAHAIREHCQREGDSEAVAAFATFLIFEATAQAAVVETGGSVWGELVPGAAYDAAKIAVEFTRDLVRDSTSALSERPGALWFDMSKARRDESVKMRVPANSAGKLRSYARRYEVATQSGGATRRARTNKVHENQLNKLRAQHTVAAKAQTTRLNKLKAELTLANTKLRTANGAISQAKAAAAAAAAAGQ